MLPCVAFNIIPTIDYYWDFGLKPSSMIGVLPPNKYSTMQSFTSLYAYFDHFTLYFLFVSIVVDA